MIAAAVVLTTSDEDLVRVAGVPVVLRSILTLGRAGVTRIVVACGRRHDAVRELVADSEDIARAGLRVEVVAAGDGASEAQALEVARGRLDGDIVVIGSARVVDPEIVRRLAASSGERGAVAVDATQRLVGACMLRAGATVPAGAALFDAIAAAPGMQRVDVGEVFWRSVATATERKDAERAMFRALKKRVDGPISRMINRRVSISITRLLVNTNITPNQMTVVATIVGAAGVYFVFQATWLAVALGAFLVQCQSILDGCDGELARLKFKSSRFGEWLDNVLDDQVNVAYGLALGYAASELLHSQLWLALGIGSAAAFLIHNAIFYAQLAFVHRSGNPFNFRWWFEKGSADVTAMLQGTSLSSLLGAFIRSLVRRDVFLFAFFVLAAVHLPQVAVTWYALVAASQFALMATHVAMRGPWRVTNRG